MTKEVRCPVCRGRLFDVEGAGASGLIVSKCPRCKQISKLLLEQVIKQSA